MKKLFSTFVGLCLSAGVANASDSPTSYEKQAVTVFQNGQGTHPAYRIPALATAKDGTVLAFIEGRSNMHDHANNDILLKRSSDNGKTWGKNIIIRKNKDVLVNPSPVVLTDGEILLFIEEFPDKSHARTGKGFTLLEKGFGAKSQKFLLFRSKDHGKTWSKAQDLTKVARGADGDVLTAGSPAAAIQIQKGKYKGRILAPIYCTSYHNNIRYNYVGTIYSDNKGKTWKRGEFAPNPLPIEKVKSKIGSCNEFHIAELDNGDVIINARGNRSGRYHSLSKDGGVTWTKLKEVYPSRRNNNAVISAKNSKNKRILVQALSAHKRNRAHGVILTSKNGVKWTKSLDVTATNSPFGYSALTVLKNGNIGLIYESFTPKAKTSKFVEIPLSQLK